MSAASALTLTSTTCSILKCRPITRSMPTHRTHLGTDPFGAPGLFDLAPYWRAAFEPHWGNNWLEIGTFGMTADIHPWVAAAARTDRYHRDFPADR